MNEVQFEIAFTVTYNLVSPYGARTVSYRIVLNEKCNEERALDEAFGILGQLRAIRGALTDKASILELVSRSEVQSPGVPESFKPDPGSISLILARDFSFAKRVFFEYSAQDGRSGGYRT